MLTNIKKTDIYEKRKSKENKKLLATKYKNNKGFSV